MCWVVILLRFLFLCSHSGSCSLSNRCGCRLNLIPAYPSTPLARPALCPGTGSAPWLPLGRYSLPPEGQGCLELWVLLSRALWKEGKQEHLKELGKLLDLRVLPSLRSPPRVNSAMAFRRPCPSKSNNHSCSSCQYYIIINKLLL